MQLLLPRHLVAAHPAVAHLVAAPLVVAPLVVVVQHLLQLPLLPLHLPLLRPLRHLPLLPPHLRPVVVETRLTMVMAAMEATP